MATVTRSFVRSLTHSPESSTPRSSQIRRKRWREREMRATPAACIWRRIWWLPPRPSAYYYVQWLVPGMMITFSIWGWAGSAARRHLGSCVYGADALLPQRAYCAHLCCMHHARWNNPGEVRCKLRGMSNIDDFIISRANREPFVINLNLSKKFWVGQKILSDSVYFLPYGFKLARFLNWLKNT